LDDSVEFLLVSMENCFVTFDSRFAGVRLLPLHSMANFEYFLLPTHFRNQSTILHFLCRLLTGYLKLKAFCGNDLRSVSEGFLWTGRCCELCDGLQGHEMWALQILCILMYTDGFERPVTEG